MTITRTIGTTGYDHPTLEHARAYLVGLGALTDHYEFVVYGIVTDTVKVAFTGYTDNGKTVTIRAATGQSVEDGGRLAWLTSGRAIMRNTMTYDGCYVFSQTGLTVRGLQFENTAAEASYVITAGTGIVKNCVIRQGHTSSGLSAVVNSTGGVGTVQNCLILPVTATGARNGGTLHLESCTVVGTGGANRGIQADYGETRAINCVVYNCGTDFFDLAKAGSTNNATDKSTFGGTGWGGSGQVSITSADFVSVTPGSEDYRQTTSSAKLNNTGAVIAGRTTDIFGTAVPQGASPDIGAFENLAGAIFSGTLVLSAVTASGSFTTAPPSSFSGALILGPVAASGTFGPNPGQITSPPLRDLNGLLVNTALEYVAIYNSTTGALIARKTGISTGSDARFTVTDFAISTSQAYLLDWKVAGSAKRRMPVGIGA